MNKQALLVALKMYGFQIDPIGLELILHTIIKIQEVDTKFTIEDAKEIQEKVNQMFAPKEEVSKPQMTVQNGKE